jgi:hypothetical protein
MKSALFLDQLPELQHLDARQRRLTLRQWRSELMKSWPFYLRAVALRVGVIALFAVLRFSLLPGPFKWLDLAWIALAWILGDIACTRLLYWKHRDLLRTILDQATPAA